MKLAAVVLRCLLGGLFIVAGGLKLRDPGAFAQEIANFRLLPALAPYLAIVLPPVEIVSGVALLALPRAWRRGGAVALTGLLAVFTVAVVSAVARGVNIDCGCFGAGTGPVSGLTVARNLGLLVVAGALLWLDRDRPAAGAPARSG
jgi:uncharacterized membrane protein YphA (DoxX/SURF4 family)